MPVWDYGYLEGDQLGKPYDLGLIRRLAAYARPHLRLLALAAVLILAGTGLEILLPYLTRLAIDRYIVRQVVAVRLQRLPAAERRQLTQALGARAWQGQEHLFVPEDRWRRLSPRLTRRLRARGAVDPRPWYPAPPGAHTAAVARAHPELFRRAGERWLIPTDRLARLPRAELIRLRTPDAWGVVRLAVIFALAALVAGALGFAQYVMLERAGQEVMFAIRQDLYRHLLSRSLAWLSRQPVGKLVTRLTNDVANLNEMYRSTLVAFCQDLFLVAGIVVVLLLLDLRLALVCLGLTPVIALLAWIFSRLARDAFRAMQGQLGRINAHLSETLSGLAVVKLFQAEAEGHRRFRELAQSYYQAGMRQIRVFAVFMPLTELFASLAAALIVWYGGGRVIQDRLSLGTLVAFLFYMQMFFRPVRDMAEKYNIMQAAMASAERIFHLLERGEALPRAKRPVRVAASRAVEVRLEGVTFGYRPEKPVLREVSFAVPPGRSWAVVGPTGAGKTTLVHLLVRLYDPWQGRVLLAGCDLRRMAEEELARLVALVPQEVFLFAGSVADNITLGRKQVTPERLRRALEVTGARQWIEELPQGLDTPLGEGARRLSAGQRQLLALARALAADPKVLILDEATSAVDPMSERLIQQALPRVMAGRTTLVVAHRLSTVRRADRILVMDRGRIVEQGTHHQLMAAGGLYHRLVRLRERSATQGGDRHGDGTAS